ncbi:MAG: PIN domain-containing protein [Chloroflexota bacterium]|nr:PIN domain-containing protein [Chloroflexota bacterium]
MASKCAVVLDTNVFVAAGFNPHSASARIIEEIRAGRLTLAWNEETRSESEAVVGRIPPLSWDHFVDLFEEDGRCEDTVRPEEMEYVPDPEDRKFAALARAVDAALITNDDDLLGSREQADVCIVAPDEFFERR